MYFGNIQRVIARQQQYAYFKSFVFNLPLIDARGASIVALRLVGSEIKLPSNAYYFLKIFT